MLEWNHEVGTCQICLRLGHGFETVFLGKNHGFRETLKCSDGVFLSSGIEEQLYVFPGRDDMTRPITIREAKAWNSWKLNIKLVRCSRMYCSREACRGRISQPPPIQSRDLFPKNSTNQKFGIMALLAWTGEHMVETYHYITYHHNPPEILLVHPS